MVRVERIPAGPKFANWIFDRPPISDVPPGTPHPALQIWIFGAWTTPVTCGPVIGNSIPCEYLNAMDLGTPARIVGTPGTFHFDGMDLKVPWTGNVEAG